MKLVLLSLLVPTVAGQTSGEEQLCDKTAETDLYVKLDFFAGEFGHFTVDGCDGVSPTLLLASGVEYTFHQQDISNWYHPLGFAYYPDGALVDATELEPNTAKSSSEPCIATESCDSPYYYKGTEFLGGPGGDGGFGLDAYEPAFAEHIERWYEEDRENIPDYNVKVSVNQPDTHEVFYFCHIHAGMSGRIRICDMTDGECVLRTGTDEDLYEVSEISSFDASCGTFGVSDYRFGGGQCSTEEFVCAEPWDEDLVYTCFEAIDCAMNVDMRVSYGGVDDRFATFLRQMIPHHQNAVNMAKIMLKQPECNTNGDEEFDNLMRSVVNGQNAQIQYMRDYLAGAGEESPEEAQCGKVRNADSFIPPESTATVGDLGRDQPCVLLPAADATFTNVTVTLDYYGGEFGYFKFSTSSSSCTGAAPNLILAADHEYRFYQNDVTNWYHPLGFAYFPDGAIVDADELEPGIDPSASGCANTEACQSPQYYIGDDFLGGESGDGGFGLDSYEPTFSGSLGSWSEDDHAHPPLYNVRLSITDSDTPEVFYFCHIHGGMSGRITVCDLSEDGSQCASRPMVGTAEGYISDTPVYLAPHTVPSRFDATCGTTGLDTYEPGPAYDKFCEDKVFLCTSDEDYDIYAACYDAMDCAMNYEMKVLYTGNCDELFINQMIPHHENAVRMAKTTLRYVESALVTECLDEDENPIEGSECPDTEATGLLREIIQSQNAQIQFMRDYLGGVEGAQSVPAGCDERRSNATTTTKVHDSAGAALIMSSSAAIMATALLGL